MYDCLGAVVAGVTGVLGVVAGSRHCVAGSMIAPGIAGTTPRVGATFESAIALGRNGSVSVGIVGGRLGGRSSAQARPLATTTTLTIRICFPMTYHPHVQEADGVGWGADTIGEAKPNSPQSTPTFNSLQIARCD
jgi:hypothetical protein